MKAIDMRNATWADIRERLSGMRLQVYEAFLRYGPATTERAARLSGISILSLRPRATELMRLGLLDLVACEGHDGVYRAVEQAEARERMERRPAPAGQLQMRLTA